MSRALILGGGGVAGIAWEIGILAGAVEAGFDPLAADRIVGTSAGATVAAQLTSGEPLGYWFDRQVDPTLQNKELRPPGMSVETLWRTMAQLAEDGPDPAELRRRVAAMALAARSVAEPVRRAVVAGRLSGDAWPDHHMATVAVDAFTGERRVFDAASGVGLIDAVAASCAVPGVWPPVTIGSTRYIDGGVFSLTNADLADGADRVVILAPLADPDTDAGALLVTPDDASLAAFGADPLDPEVMAPSAVAGRAQGRARSGRILAYWNS